jgi:chromosome segregation ATPase
MEGQIKDMELEFKNLKNDLKRQENCTKISKDDVSKEAALYKDRSDDLEAVLKTLREELKDRGLDLERLKSERVRDEEQVRSYEREKNQVEYDLGNKLVEAENDTMKIRIDHKDLKVKYNKLEEKWTCDKELYSNQIQELTAAMGDYREKSSKQIDSLKENRNCTEKDLRVLGNSLQESEGRREKLQKELAKAEKVFSEKENLLGQCIDFIEDLYGLCRKEKSIAQYLKSFQFKKNQIEKKYKVLKNPTSDYFSRNLARINGGTGNLSSAAGRRSVSKKKVVAVKGNKDANIGSRQGSRKGSRNGSHNVLFFFIGLTMLEFEN